ncbi:MAG: FtsW/RodA/SpoVE family cell cycle protein [Clostridiales bacterium]|nr:FtsW/RodA/SpoVE family cell cycle protein [Clostridiales bacterium]
MVELLIFLSKYLFIILAAIFCLQSVYIVSKGRQMDYPSAENTKAVKLQRATTILFHVLAYATLYFNSEIPLKDYMITALGGLALILAVPPFIRIVYGKINGLVINCMYFLMDLSLVILQRLNPDYALKQLMYFFIGSACILLIYPLLKYCKNFHKLKYGYLGLGFLLLLLTLVFGTTTRGATNWIYIGSFSFQPSEIVKLLYVFYFASVFSRKITFKETVAQMAVGLIFVCLLALQRDLGSALIFFMTLLIMVFISTGNIIVILGSLVCACVGAFGAYKMFSHIQVRVAAWLDPWSDIGNTTYQIAQSLFAIGSGGLWGSGLGKGYASSIPIVESDFIFSAICEEFGVIFAVFVIFIYLTIFYCGARSALNAETKFNAILASGLTGLICFQTFLIIGGVTKFVPLTGVTLPFVSYGGTSVVITSVIIGILLWIYVPKTEFSEDKQGTDEPPKKRRRKTAANSVNTSRRRPSSQSRTGNNSESGSTASRQRPNINTNTSGPLSGKVRRRDDE